MAQTQLFIGPRPLNVNEIFGPTIQGEGPHTGLQVAFVRVAGCNLSCVWCDTPYSWDWDRFDRSKESRKMTVEEVLAQIEPMAVERIILTGGEPMLQQTQIPALAAAGYKIDVETNGTRTPTAETIAAVDLFCVSPKLAHAGDPEKLRVRLDALKAFSDLADAGKAYFKFVAQQESDLDEIAEFCKAADIADRHVWVMPEGADADTHLKNLRDLADKVIARHWNLTSRLHVFIWNTERAH